MNENIDITVRRATFDDANLLTELGRQTFCETFAADNTAEDIAAYVAANFSAARQTAELSDHASTFLIAEVEELAAGYARLKNGQPPVDIEGTDPIELVRLYVLKEWLGRGVGEALMRACLDEARSAGYKTVWLGVWERNTRAQAFYRKWHFRDVGEHVFQLGSDAQRDILMERSVESS